MTLLMASSAIGQNAYKPKNLGNFDNRLYHFGFSLGINSADLFLERAVDTAFADSLVRLQPSRVPGFNIGIIGSVKLYRNLTARFVPALSFQDRVLEYTFMDDQGEEQFFEKRIESTYIDFPVHFKYRSDRINNFAVYVLAGAKYSIDLQTREEVNNNNADEVVVKMKRNDYSMEIGGGFDFFLTYFKFGIELKMAIGFPNQIVKDNTMFSRPIDRLRTQAFFFTLTFEG